MKAILKKVLKVICFMLIFSLLLTGAQLMLNWRVFGDEYMFSRYIDYQKHVADSIDVLYFGTSEMYAGVAPIIMYEEEGITGYNFALSYRSAVTVYYQLLYTLQSQTPKIVVCDFSSLYDDSLPEERDILYRRIYGTMSDEKIKKDMSEDILRLAENPNYWKYPFLRYHSTWSSLKEIKFVKDENFYNDEYKSYSKGCLLWDSSYKGEIFSVTEELWEPEDDGKRLSDISVEYYDKFIDLCHSKGIKVVALNAPLYHPSTMAFRHDEMKEYYDSRDVDFFDYNNYESFKKLGLDLEEHFYNTTHLNVKGAMIFSKQLASDLKSAYNLEDRRTNEIIATEWSANYKLFLDDFKEVFLKDVVNPEL